MRSNQPSEVEDPRSRGSLCTLLIVVKRKDAVLFDKEICNSLEAGDDGRSPPTALQQRM